MENEYNNKWGDFFFIYILNLYYNYEIFKELIMFGVKINVSDFWNNWIFLFLVVGNDILKYGDYDYEELGVIWRDKIVYFLLSNGVDIILCIRDGVSFFYIVCKYGYESIV